MKSNNLNIVIVGVGGQGTLLASKLLARLAMSKNLGIKVSEIHGMSQRGGSVITHVRIGNDVHAPLVASKSADYLLAFEPLEAARAIGYLKEDGVMIVNSQQISPITVLSGAAVYPENPHKEAVSESQTIEIADAFEIAKNAGSYKAVNIVLLGLLSKHLDFDEKDWESAIEASVPPKTLEINKKAFFSGREYTM